MLSVYAKQYLTKYDVIMTESCKLVLLITIVATITYIRPINLQCLLNTNSQWVHHYSEKICHRTPLF